jgi:sarcosine oxidase
MKQTFETIVIGLGAMGSAATYQLARAGNNVLGIDQFTPPHTQGSSHGDTRITRQAIGEGAEYVPLVLRSYEIWDELEKATGKKLLTITGGLILTSAEQSTLHGSDFFNQTVASAEKYHIAHRLLDTNQIRKEFPQFKLCGNEKGYFEEKAGYLRPELCIGTQLQQARRYGAKLATNEKVIGLTASGSGDSVRVKTDTDEYEAEKAIISAGSWVSQLLGKTLGQYFTVYRQVMYWFAVDGSISQFEAPHFPVWIWAYGNTDEDAMYGFPAIDGQAGGVKLATEQYSIPTNPNNVSRQVTEQEIKDMYQKYVESHFAGLSSTCVKAAACLYTVTPDHRFVIDTHPDFPQVTIASPCSGHGFKHSAAIGKVLAQLATTGKSDIDISTFSFARLSSTGN